MAAGLQVDKDYLNSKTGAIGVQLGQLFAQITNLQRGLTGWDANRLVNEKGYAQADADDLVAALVAMVKIKNVAQGTAAQAQAVNLMGAIDKVTGID